MKFIKRSKEDSFMKRMNRFKRIETHHIIYNSIFNPKIICIDRGKNVNCGDIKNKQKD